MFLLFPKDVVQTGESISTIYIPICFYYFVYRIVHWVKRWEIYIPICFYYFLDRFVFIYFLYDIYIPICFYYFGMERATVFVALTWFTFQYVSIISIKSVKKYSRRNLIYIPICFYYFSMPITANTTAGKIYIPICFYYFCFRQSVKQGTMKIYIPICFYYF